jgi:hypothetical protein
MKLIVFFKCQKAQDQKVAKARHTLPIKQKKSTCYLTIPIHCVKIVKLKGLDSHEYFGKIFFRALERLYEHMQFEHLLFAPPNSGLK